MLLEKAHVNIDSGGNFTKVEIMSSQKIYIERQRVQQLDNRIISVEITMITTFSTRNEMREMKIK